MEKSSPNYTRGGVTAYSSMDELVFDRGVWDGETDTYGISGVSAGSAADKTVCGSPLVTLTINKEGADGAAVTLSSLIVSILDYYNTHDYYNYGGVDYIKENCGQLDGRFICKPDQLSDAVLCSGGQFFRECDILPGSKYACRAQPAAKGHLCCIQ